MAPELMLTARSKRDKEIADGQATDSNSTSESFDVLKFERKTFSFTELARMDVFSFGVLLWSIAILDYPYRGVSPFECYRQVGLGQRPPLSFLRDGGSSWAAAVADIIEECWAQDPLQRPAMEDVTKRLNQLAAFQ